MKNNINLHSIALLIWKKTLITFSKGVITFMAKEQFCHM